MTLRVARLALPFTDSDISAATADIRCYNTATATAFTATVALPSVSGVSAGYYNGGDLGTADTSTYALPGESLIMAVAEAIAAAGAFDITVTEGALPGSYVMTRKDTNQWEIRWDDALTTFQAQWLGFAVATYASTAQVITAPYQSDRLWVAHRPTWNRVREHKKTSHAMTWSGGVSTRQLSSIRNEYELKYSAQPGPRVYAYDGTLANLVALVPGMAVDDPNVALESLWQWCAARTPFQYWPDETDLTDSVYLRPSHPEELDGVIRTVRGERSNTPPVYDIVMNFVLSTAGSAGIGGGGVICAPASNVLLTALTYDALPTVGVSDGDMYMVTTTAAAGVYTYVTMLDGYQANVWLPATWVARGLTWVVDASGYPARYDGPAGETKSTLTSRGWIDASVTGTVTDGTNVLILNSVTTPDYAWFYHSPVAYTLGNVAMVMECDQVAITTTDNNNEGFIVLRDGYRSQYMGYATNNTKNKLAFVQAASSIEQGTGHFGITSFQRVFAELEVGSAATWPTAAESGLARMWTANGGWSPTTACSVEKSHTTATTENKLGMWTQSFSSTPTTLHVKRMYLLHLGIP